MKKSCLGQKDRLSHELKNKTIKMGNLTKETLETLDMLDLYGFLHFVEFETINNQYDVDVKEQRPIKRRKKVNLSIMRKTKAQTLKWHPE